VIWGDPSSGVFCLLALGAAGHLEAIAAVNSGRDVLTLCREITFAAVVRRVNLSWHRVKAICDRYVDLPVAATDLSDATATAIKGVCQQRCCEWPRRLPFMPR
jgi:hypothetical protein